jgi:hypothetical protein
MSKWLLGAIDEGYPLTCLLHVAQEKRGFADAILAAGTTALMYSVYM